MPNKAQNMTMTPEYEGEWKDDYRARRMEMRYTPQGSLKDLNDEPALAVSEDRRREVYTERWAAGDARPEQRRHAVQLGAAQRIGVVVDALIVGDPSAVAMLDFIAACSYVFAVLFTIELVVKLVARYPAPLDFFLDNEEGGFNCFDFAIVAVSDVFRFLHVGGSLASLADRGPPGGRFYACLHSSQTSGCSETIESVRNPPETGWAGSGCFPAVVRWSQTVTSTCGGPAVGRARGLPKFYNKCCRFYNKLQVV